MYTYREYKRLWFYDFCTMATFRKSRRHKKLLQWQWYLREERVRLCQTGIKKNVRFIVTVIDTFELNRNWVLHMNWDIFIMLSK